MRYLPYCAEFEVDSVPLCGLLLRETWRIKVKRFANKLCNNESQMKPLFLKYVLLSYIVGLHH